MCGLYLESDGAACEECKKSVTERRKTICNYDDLENMEDTENEQYYL